MQIAVQSSETGTVSRCLAGTFAPAWKRGVQDARSGGIRLRGHLSSTFHHQRRVAGRVHTDRTRADFHGAFFFRGRVRRVPLFPVNTAEISESGVKGKRKKHVGREPIFRGNEKPSRRLSPVPLPASPSLYFPTFVLLYLLRSFPLWTFNFPQDSTLTKKPLFRWQFILVLLISRIFITRVLLVQVSSMETAIYFRVGRGDYTLKNSYPNIRWRGS